MKYDLMVNATFALPVQGDTDLDPERLLKLTSKEVANRFWDDLTEAWENIGWKLRDAEFEITSAEPAEPEDEYRIWNYEATLSADAMPGFATVKFKSPTLLRDADPTWFLPIIEEQTGFDFKDQGVYVEEVRALDDDYPKD